MPMHMTQGRHPRGVLTAVSWMPLIREFRTHILLVPVSKQWWIFDQILRRWRL